MGSVKGIHETKTGMLRIKVGDARGFLEEVGLHVLIEVSIVGVIDSFLKNTVVSMLLGICIVEGCQMAWRRWRDAQ
jgi:hypothetical protein